MKSPPLILVVLSIYLAPLQAFGADDHSARFSFTAAGDLAATTHTTAVLKKIAKYKPAFHIALGDLSYDMIKPEKAWCDYVKKNLGEEIPFELLTGNHESNGRDGFIENFADCMPDRLGAQGEYPKEYLFDYPPKNPLARFIVVSPGLQFTNKEVYVYKKDSPHYKWLSDKIDEARAKKIPWVIIGMHKTCLSVGLMRCDTGTDIFNLLLSKKVDLILQGHDHTYQRTKQLALGNGCSELNFTEYNGSCVAGESKGRPFKKGAGTVILINGTMGADQGTIDMNADKAAYFEGFMGANWMKSYGYSAFEVSKYKLKVSYIAAEGRFKDDFEIIGI